MGKVSDAVFKIYRYSILQRHCSFLKKESYPIYTFFWKYNIWGFKVPYFSWVPRKKKKRKKGCFPPLHFHAFTKTHGSHPPLSPLSVHTKSTFILLERLLQWPLQLSHSDTEEQQIHAHHLRHIHCSTTDSCVITLWRLSPATLITLVSPSSLPTWNWC